MVSRRAPVFFLGLAVLTACAAAGEAPTSAAESRIASAPEAPESTVPSPTIPPTACAEAGATSLSDVPGEFPLLTAETTYWVDPDADASTSLCAMFTVPADGWSAFIGTFKDVDVDGAVVERVSALMHVVTNLTVDACSEQVALDPPVGASVDDLATALTQLPPFEVASPPQDVTMYGYSGKHLALRVPTDAPFADGRFEGCSEGVLRSWIGPPLSFAFYGYAAPGDTEDYWILDVEGTRLVIIALTSGASDALIAERQMLLDSIVIEP